jgi:hypothetical protein
MQQPHENQKPRGDAASHAAVEEIALWALRRAGGAQWRCPLAAAIEPAIIERELAGIAADFDKIFNQPAGTGGPRPMQLGSPGCLGLTKDERRMLHAVAATQAGDEALLDNYLYKLALDRPARRRLAEAVRKLAACLALHGCWLPRPPSAMPLPGGALSVARVQGRDLNDVHVAWP